MKKSYRGKENKVFLDLFRERAEGIQDLAQSLEIHIRPYVSAELPHFSKLESSRQEAICAHLGVLIGIYTRAQGAMDQALDPRHLVWMAMKEFDFRPPADFFDKIHDEDVVQVYNDQGVQLFSNLKFFDLCSYTLEEICVFDWTDLWERDLEALRKLEAVMMKMLMDDSIQSTVIPNEGEHRVKEINSMLGLELAYSLKAIAPVWSRLTNQKAGFVVIEKGRILSANPAKGLDGEILNAERELNSRPAGPSLLMTSSS